MARPYEIRKIDDLANPIWEQQAENGETTEMYAMFMCYRNIRPAERTIVAAWRVWVKDTSLEGKPISSAFGAIAQAFLWQERAATYDVARLQDRYKVWGQRDWALRDEVWDAGEKLHRKAMSALDKIKDEELNLSLAEIANLLRTSTELREKAIPSIGTLNTNQIREVLSAMPENKRDAVLRIVVAEWKQIAPNDAPGKKPPMPVAVADAIDAEYREVKENLLLPQMIYPNYIEERLLNEAIRRVKSISTRRKLREGSLNWREFISDTEAEEVAAKARRPRGFLTNATKKNEE